MSTLRRAGAVWRFLVHHHADNGRFSDHAHHIQSDRVRVIGDSEGSTTTTLPRTEFDELVVGNRFIHIEQLDNGLWTADFAGLVLELRANRDGQPTFVGVFGPGNHSEPVPGCRFELNWSAPQAFTAPPQPKEHK